MYQPQETSRPASSDTPETRISKANIASNGLNLLATETIAADAVPKDEKTHGFFSFGLLGKS